ncbi:metal ABC transporter permease [Xanthobacter autotrophicus DSM 431]|uniref:metal ABC transporter permease n=1 Tax=Xanthobacter nonsaccharivorans TaxID=3119912 RepID=UPI003728290D
MNPYELLIAPFTEFEFMRRALAGVFALALGAGPLGAFLMLRRMSLTGDAMAHAILPGAAIGFLFAGLNLYAMTAGGLAAGLLVAIGAGVVARATGMKEDASMAAFYLISLALGVLIVSLRGSNVDLLHVLFGTVLGIDDATLILIAGITTVTLLTLAFIWRPLVLECVDPTFLASVSGAGGVSHIAFLSVVVMNLVGGFHALGTLLSVGLMMLPAATGRFFVRDLTSLVLLSSLIAFAAGAIGLLVSYHLGTPSGPSIILVAGLAYAAAVVFGPLGGLLSRVAPRRHLEA